MGTKKLLCILTSVTLFGLCMSNAQEHDLSIPEGPYLGQEPPGKTPEIFAPGLISTDATEFGITISKDSYEIYFSRRESMETGNRIHAYKYESGQWVTLPQPLFGWEGRESEPNFSPDERRLYFGSGRPKPEMVTDTKMPVQWYVERIGDKWSTPEMIGTPVIEYGNMFLTQANNGTIYFTGFNPEKGIYSARKKGDGFDTPHYLPKEINHLVNPAYPRYFNPAHPGISPDESYIIYDNAVDDKWTTNLFISFRKDHYWSKASNITEYIGWERESWGPFVSFDGKYLFFSSGGNIYWVDAGFIEELRSDID